MIYLDTHVVAWLYAGLTDKLSDIAKTLINNNELYISAIVRLELQYLYEIKRLSEKSDSIISDLTKRIGLQICHRDLNLILDQSVEITWTQDPFDRIITADASLDNAILISKDPNILNNYNKATW